MNLATIRELYKEPDCSHNAQKTDKTCPRPTPGRAAGGCSFDGAQITLVPITDAAHIVHGPIGCVGNTWNNRGSLSSGSSLYRKGFTTNLNNNDIVFGGEKKLFKAVKEIAKAHNPPAIFVYQTCVTSMIGDDIEALCKAATEKFGVKVIPVDSPGFTGTKNFGNRLAGDALLKHLIGTEEPKNDHPYNVNFIGEFNIAGEQWEMVRLLDEVGIRLISSLSGDARVREVGMMHRAQVNMMVCSRALLNVARRMKEDYDIPYFEGSFYGAKNTTKTILTIAEYMNDPALMKKAEAICKAEYEKVKPELDELKAKLAGKKVLLYTGGVKSWSVVAALQELGMEVIATGTKKSTEEDKQRIQELMGSEATMISEGSPAKLLELCRSMGADMMLAGGRNQYTALKAGIPFVDVNQERHIPFAGYTGHVILGRTILGALESPAFKLVKRPNPFI